MESFDERLQFEIKKSKNGWSSYKTGFNKLDDISIRQIFSTIHEVNLQRDETGIPIPGTGRLITNDEKKMIFDYILENNYPLTKRFYNFILREYINGEVELINKNSHKL